MSSFNDGIDDLVNNVSLNEKTELEGVADQVFRNEAGRTKLNDIEISACFVTKIVFSSLGMSNDDPTSKFLELKKSHEGWNMDKFVEATGGAQNARSGGVFGGFLKDRLFTPKQ